MLIQRHRSCLILVDFQEKLLPSIEGGAAAVARARILVEAARRLDVPIAATEQYSPGLGRTEASLRALVPPGNIVEKQHFAAGREPVFRRLLAELRRPDFVLAGCETHVCLLQTALSLREDGSRVVVVRDAVGSRRAADRDAALARMERQGVELATSEMVAFEWLERAPSPEFRDLLPLLK
jgi:nicotinamidase-related amidase